MTVHASSRPGYERASSNVRMIHLYRRAEAVRASLGLSHCLLRACTLGLDLSHLSPYQPKRQHLLRTQWVNKFRMYNGQSSRLETMIVLTAAVDGQRNKQAFTTPHQGRHHVFACIVESASVPSLSIARTCFTHCTAASFVECLCCIGIRIE